MLYNNHHVLNDFQRIMREAALAKRFHPWYIAMQSRYLLAGVQEWQVCNVSKQAPSCWSLVAGLLPRVQTPAQT